MKAGPFATVALAVIVLVLVPLAAYVGGYFCFGFRLEANWEGSHGEYDRAYEQEWQAIAFHPAARIESWLTGREVTAVWYNPIRCKGIGY